MNQLMDHISVGILAAVVTSVTLFPLRMVLRRFGIVDRPNARSSHMLPTVRGGGIAIVVTISVAFVWQTFCSSLVPLVLLLGTFGLLAVVSFIDDLRGVAPFLRLVIQVFCALAAVLVLMAHRDITIFSLGLCLVGAIWLSGYTNAFNFMDGINGIAAVQALMGGLGTAEIADKLGLLPTEAPVFLGYIIAGSALGFLPYNFPRARVFMGDVSSAPLGFLLATLAFWVAEQTSWWVMFWIALLHANFVLDTAITMARRAFRGEKIWEAHREHFYQRLVRAGWSHTAVTLTEGGLQVLVATVLWWATPAGATVKVTVGAGVILLWLAFFAFAEGKFQSFTKAQAGQHTPSVTRHPSC